MKPGSYLLFADYQPPRLAVVTRTASSEVEYEWFEFGCRKRGILAKCDPDSYTYLGIHEGKKAYGIVTETISLQRLQSAFDGIVAESRAKMEAEQALERERVAREQAELDRLREEQAEQARREAEKRERMRALAQAFKELDLKFSENFQGGYAYWNQHLSSSMSEDEFRERRTNFVRTWFDRHTDLSLDEEQAEAVAECGSHIQVTARAGSGKTRTLVARTLFQITHCRIPASGILILAFNKRAVEEIRERLAKYLSEEQMPHVLTFHALAYRVVRPQEDLIYDEGDSKEGQVFSTTIQRIVDEKLRGGGLEGELRALVEDRWAASLERIVRLGYDLPKEQFLIFRGQLPCMTIDGRRLHSEIHKQIGNTLLRHRLRYSYQKSLHRFAGATYAPDFMNFQKEGDSRIVIEVLEPGFVPPNPARVAFWNSDRAKNTALIQVPAELGVDPGLVSQYVINGLKDHGVQLDPMDDDELWEAVRDDVIRDFTKAVKGFISRCQKELLTPEILAEKAAVMSKRSDSIQQSFWRISGKIHQRYLEVLAAEGKTDFDQLMRNAAGRISTGETAFTSARGVGNLARIRHVLIDEFQDFSHLFEELRRAFITQSPEALFFCVGDDWQAINKFAGSDLRYFIRYQDLFQPSVRKLISRNYRSCRRIVETGNEVMKGRGEPSVPDRTEEGKVLLLCMDGDVHYSEAEELVAEELGDRAVAILRVASEAIRRDLDITILSRTSHFATPEGGLKIESLEKRLRKYLPEHQGKRLHVSTTHGYKGKEADAVILLEPEGYPLMHQDAIFSAIFGDSLESIEEDERRLFYVGVTRARSLLFLLPDPAIVLAGTIKIPFLPNSVLSTLRIDRLKSELVCGDRVIVRLSNKPGYSENSGTYPLRDMLKAQGFKWKDERKIWLRFLDPGSISSPYECTQYLQKQAWIKNADGIVAVFAWEDQLHRMRIDRGTVVPDGSPPMSQDVPQIIGGQWKPIPARTGQMMASASPGISVVEHAAPQSSNEALPYPVTRAANLDQSERPAKSTGSATGVFETGVAGMRYEGRMEKASHLSIGDFVKLEREPGNTHDRNAIQVMTSEGVRIGYVSRHVAAHLATGLDAWGGIWQAKVSSVWKQPPPHFLVSIQICFPLPPGVVIPEELDATTRLEDGPFGNSRFASGVTSIAQQTRRECVEFEHVPSESLENIPEGDPECPTPEIPLPSGSPDSLSGSLTPSQKDALSDLLDPTLGGLITQLYLSGCCPWPYIGYEARNSHGICTGSMLEVAWPDFKIGVAIPANDVGSFDASGWTILPAASVSAAVLRSLFSVEAVPAQPIEIVPTENMENAFGTTETDLRHQQGPFSDDEPDEDIPF